MKTRKCVQCGKTFTITDSEEQFYQEKNLTLPKRCKECREKNKKKASAGQDREENRPNVSAGAQTKHRGGIKYLLAVAAAVLVLAFGGKTGVDLLTPSTQPNTVQEDQNLSAEYHFRNSSLLKEHYEKHGVDMGFRSEKAYEAAASAVVTSEDALHKIESEDGDDVYYLEETNEFVIVSKDGYIRTYFSPEDGLSYYNRQ